MPTENTQRFGDRVDNYVRYRPHYPEAVLHYLHDSFGLAPSHTVIDIGSGTGISSEMFLKNGNHVIGIEPNEPMRTRSLSLLKDYSRFEAVDGTAEQTGLSDASADFIVAGQAFHWFDRDRAKNEFHRILKPNGVTVLMWNERLVDTEFARLYDQLIIDHAIDYVTVDHRNIEPAMIAAFFAPAKCTLKTFANSQTFDFEGLKGRLSSSSYVPNEGQPGYALMIEALKDLFNQYCKDDVITINYDTNVYVSRRAELY
ncbi:class I SAM-dependent methyltransferase [Chryseolinea sp. T2]|uniref:class I SAM-dependent methyltransferase n=1 Tax=Chryseolinea sp. T2 TaxID=3129255 RepID=UPI003078748A